MPSTSLERDCIYCDEGAVEIHFDLQPREPDVGIMQGYATFDYADPCYECGTEPSFADEEITRLEEDAIDKLANQERYLP